MTQSEIQTTPPDAPVATTSKLSRRWLIRITLICIGFTAFGLFGLYDALVRYPAQAIRAAENLEFKFLEQLSDEHQTIRASIADPEAKLAELREKDSKGNLSTLERAEHDWLEQLSVVNKLNPGSASTAIPRTDFRGDEVKSFESRLAELKARWTTSAGGEKNSTKHSAWDFHTQWIILAVGVGVGAYSLFLIISAKAKVYRWDPEQQRLTLPGGASLVPADIEEFDKRKWHRFYITLKIKPTHTPLGGQSLTLDLMRYEHVEGWVLAMERTAFPEETKPDVAEPAATTEVPPANEAQG